MECYAPPWSEGGGEGIRLLHIVARETAGRGIAIRAKKLQGGCYSVQLRKYLPRAFTPTEWRIIFCQLKSNFGRFVQLV